MWSSESGVEGRLCVAAEFVMVMVPLGSLGMVIHTPMEPMIAEGEAIIWSHAEARK